MVGRGFALELVGSSRCSKSSLVVSVLNLNFSDAPNLPWWFPYSVSSLLPFCYFTSHVCRIFPPLCGSDFVSSVFLLVWSCGFIPAPWALRVRPGRVLLVEHAVHVASPSFVGVRVPTSSARQHFVVGVRVPTSSARQLFGVPRLAWLGLLSASLPASRPVSAPLTRRGTPASKP